MLGLRIGAAGRSLRDRFLHEARALRKLGRYVLSGRDAPAEIARPRPVRIDPCIDRVLPGSQRSHREARGPAVVRARRHRDLAPAGLRSIAEAQDGREEIVAVGVNRGLDDDLLAESPLDREAAVVDLRRHVLDDGTLRRGCRRVLAAAGATQDPWISSHPLILELSRLDACHECILLLAVRQGEGSPSKDDRSDSLGP